MVVVLKLLNRAQNESRLRLRVILSISKPLEYILEKKASKDKLRKSHTQNQNVPHARPFAARARMRVQLKIQHSRFNFFLLKTENKIFTIKITRKIGIDLGLGFEKGSHL